MDWRVYEDSRIGRLPGPIRPLALLARNAAILYVRKLAPMRQYPHRFDGVATRHNDGFRRTPAFERALARAVRASGWDFGIPYRVHQALWCARLARRVGGDFVELGTGRGFMMSAVLADYPDWAQDGRTLHLFDTFLSTYPDKHGVQRPDGSALPHYATSIEDVRANFSEWPRVELHQGDVLETLPKAGLGPVAFAHIDLNYSPPEVFGLRYLWPLIPKGGVVLLDDYAQANHVPQYEPMNRLAEELGFDILSTPTGQGIILK
jgi:O-methyltransferase